MKNEEIRPEKVSEVKLFVASAYGGGDLIRAGRSVFHAVVDHRDEERVVDDAVAVDIGFAAQAPEAGKPKISACSLLPGDLVV